MAAEASVRQSDFERWLFDGQRLSPEHQQALANALAVSPEMRALTAGWREAQADLLAAPLAAPAPGFARRWKRRLLDHQAARRRRQIAWVLVGTLLGALLSLVLLAVLALHSPAGLAASALQALIRLARLFDSGVRLTGALVDGFPAVAGAVLTSVTLAWLSAIWFASLYRFAFQNLPDGGRE